MSKEKKKKEKKVLGVPVNFDFGQKVKDIKIDTNKYRIANLIYLVVLNVLLFAVMIYFLTVIHNGWTITIAIFTMSTCLMWSIATYVLSVLKIKYTLHENAIVKNFDTSVNVGELSKLTSIKIGKTFLDRIGKNKTSSITLRFSNKWCDKIVLSCISDNINEVAEQIILYSGKAKQLAEKEAKSKPIKIKKSIKENAKNENIEKDKSTIIKSFINQNKEK